MKKKFGEFPYHRGTAPMRASVGDILCSTFSRRSERCRAYEVMSADTGSVLLREIGWHVFMSQGRRYAVPLPGKYIGFSERLQIEEGKYCEMVQWEDRNEIAVRYHKGHSYPADLVKREIPYRQRAGN